MTEDRGEERTSSVIAARPVAFDRLETYRDDADLSCIVHRDLDAAHPIAAAHERANVHPAIRPPPAARFGHVRF